MRVRATVVSRPTDARAVIDAGTKVLTSDLYTVKGYGHVIEYPQAAITSLSEEHGVVDLSACPERPAVGRDRAASCPTTAAWSATWSTRSTACAAIASRRSGPSPRAGPCADRRTPARVTAEPAAQRGRQLALLSAAELMALSLWFSASAVLPTLTSEWQLGDAGRAVAHQLRPDRLHRGDAGERARQPSRRPVPAPTDGGQRDRWARSPTAPSRSGWTAPARPSCCASSPGSPWPAAIRPR